MTKIRKNFKNFQVPAGSRFGRWEVLDHPVVRENTRYLWLCRCECGTERAVRPDRLRSGESQSCGCLQREIAVNNTGTPTHGLSKTPEYKSWQQAKQRCFNPAHHLYGSYGGRGISMAEIWRDDFLAFYEDVGSRPSRRHSLGRIDNNGDYTPGNVEWQLPSQQNRNRRRPRRPARRPGAGFWHWRGKWRPL